MKDLAEGTRSFTSHRDDLTESGNSQLQDAGQRQCRLIRNDLLIGIKIRNQRGVERAGFFEQRDVLDHRIERGVSLAVEGAKPAGGVRAANEIFKACVRPAGHERLDGIGDDLFVLVVVLVLVNIALFISSKDYLIF